MAEHTYGSTIGKSAEAAMRRWAIGMEVQERVAHEHAVERLPEQVHPYLAVSRDAGAGAGTIAHRVGERLGWDVLDRELLNHMAEKYNLQQGMVEFVDEKQSSWIIELFGKWLDGRVVTQSEFVQHLGELVLLAAHHGSNVFVGRGTQFMLPRERGVAVQIIAPRKVRLKRVMERVGLSRADAEHYIDETDKSRRDFVQRYFHQDVTDPHHYDLVINIGFVSQDETVDLIVEHIQRRFGNT